MNDSGSKASEATTVAWMLSLLATVAAEVLGIGTRLVGVFLGDNPMLYALSGTLLLIAALTGILLLILTPLTVKFRDTPPPQPLVIAAIGAGIVPLITLALVLTR